MRPLVRRYRYLVESVSTADAARAHVRALDALDRPTRWDVLHHVRSELLAGTRTGPDDTVTIARYLLTAEQRRPGVLAGGLSDAVVDAVVDELERRAGSDVLAGYRAWVPAAVEAADAAPLHHLVGAWDRIEDDPVYAFMMDSQKAPASQPPKVRR